MAYSEKIYYVNGMKLTKTQIIAKGIELCLMGDDTSKYEAKCVDCPYFDTDIETFKCKAYLLEDALELLKEQEALKPTVSVDTWICSKCGHTLESQELIDDKENPQVLIHEQYNYCPNCGRTVKWDDD